MIRSTIAATTIVIWFFAGAIDRIEYAITSVRLAIVDKVCGPVPATITDLQQAAEREDLQRAFLQST